MTTPRTCPHCGHPLTAACACITAMLRPVDASRVLVITWGADRQARYSVEVTR